MSQALAESFVANYRVEHHERTGSFDGCDPEQVRLEHRGEMGAGFHEYEVVGCGDGKQGMFTSYHLEALGEGRADIGNSGLDQTPRLA